MLWSSFLYTPVRISNDGRLSYISEKKVRQLGLGFLKSYYRNRSRTGQTELSSDMRGLGGIRADGYLSSRMAGRRRFEAALEATSYTSRKELRYSLQRKLLVWDSLAVGCMALVALAALSQYFHFAFVPQIGLIGVLFWMLGCFLIVFLAYRFSASGLQRYRYIYAVEQFRLYRADEQWIALSEEVFEQGREDPFFLELRKQCIHYGIGILWVDRNEEVHLILAASRSRGEQDKRSSIRWTAAQRLSRPLGRMVRAAGSSRATPRQPKSEDYTNRFQRGYRHQLAISLLSLTLVGGLLYSGWRQRPIRYLGEREFLNRIEDQLENPVPEPVGFLIDTPFLLPYAQSIQPYLAVLNRDYPMGPFPLNSPLYPGLSAIPGLFVSIAADTVAQFPCTRLPRLQSDYYLLRESRYERLEPALERLNRLQTRGWQANVLSMECIQPSLRGYVVFVGVIYKDREEAKEAWADLPKGRGRLSPDAIPLSDLILNQ